MVGVAVNVTDVPEQIEPEGLAEIVIAGVRFGFTVIVILADVAGLPVAHVAFDVRTHVIISPLANVVLVNVTDVAPTIFTPFFFH